MPDIMKSRKEKLANWSNSARICKSWVDFLATVPPNTVQTDREWFLAGRKFASAEAAKPAKA